ncbi:MAG: hydrogenase expression/formation protein HypE [Saprospiraceae bacterium]|nr:hydrogenase expression/formation protein HypE [Saprospiraceae bacterium]
MPELDFEIITLGHGSGGLLSNQLLESGVFDLLSNEYLDQHHDGATINLTGRTAVSTDSFVVSPVFFPGGNIGDLAVNGTVNDINMCGARAKFLTLSFILEEGLTMKAFWEILVSIRNTANEAGVKIITGDTKVVERGKGDQIFINTTGIGEVHPTAQIGVSQIKTGDQIIVSGPLATHGVAILSVRQGLEFETTIRSDTRHFNHIVPPLMEAFGSHIHLLKDPTRGGLASVLNEVCRDSRKGIDLLQTAIPVLDEVNGACELLGLDPLYVANEGVFIIFADSEVVPGILEYLRQCEGCEMVSVIGAVTSDHAGQVVMQSAIGGRRVVNMLVGEQLPRIC